MTKRQPFQGYVAAYGAPSPVGEWWQPQDPGWFGPTNTATPINVTEAEPRRLRVAVRLDEDGRLHVLVSEDGEKVAESSTDGDSLAVEVDI